MSGSRSPRDKGVSRFRAGLIALLVIGLACYAAFAGVNPFADAYELQAVVRTANNLQPGSPVRIAGVDVGKVTTVEPLDGAGSGAKVTMEIADQGLPIHEDASLKIRPRIFLEGNFFVDLEPGSASAPILREGERPIPITRTAAPVQLGQVVSALQSDTRSDLQSFLREYSKALRGAGARGFNRSIRYWEQAYRGSALANDAALGIEPSADLPRVLRGQQRTFGALARDEPALQGLVSNFNTTAAALARESQPLQASLPALRDTLTVAQPALRSLNNALPELRAFATDALPGVRSSGPTLEQSVPFTRELRALVRQAELRGLARELRVRLPALVRLARSSVPFLGQNRALAACAD